MPETKRSPQTFSAKSVAFRAFRAVAKWTDDSLKASLARTTDAASCYAPCVANDALVQSIKEIVTLAKAGNLDGAYLGYRDLFSSAEFQGYRPEDKRQALRLMILMKGVPSAGTSARTDAHAAALGPLTEMVSTLREPSDYELLGICHVVLGDEEAANAIFKSGLALERERNPDSDLCGSLLKRLSML